MDVSPTTVRLSVAACTTTDQLREAVGVLQSLALQGDVKALALWLKYVEPTPSKRCAPMRIDEQQLETVDGCRAAYMDIMRELAAGNLDHDSAAALRATVEGAVRTHQIQASQEHELMLASAGSESIILDAADPDIAGQIQRAVDAINAPSEDDDD